MRLSALRSVLPLCAVLVLSALCSPALAGDRGPVAAPGSGETELLFSTGFEPGEDFPASGQHSITDEVARWGGRSLKAEVDEDTPVRQYYIPITGRKGRRVRVSFWRRSSNACRLALFWEVPNERTGGLDRRRVFTIEPPGGGWAHVEHTFVPDADEGGRLSIVWPSIYGGGFDSATAWLDDLRIEDVGPSVEFSLDHAEDFPALTADGAGTHWLAVEERRDFASMIRPQVGVFRVTADGRERVCTLRPDGITGMSPPAIAPLPNGCLVAFGAEVNGTYKLLYARVTPESGGAPELHTVRNGGKSNICPDLAAHGDRVCMVWESNAHGVRSVWASWVTPRGHSAPTAVSSRVHDDCNPCATATDAGDILVAWDSMRGGNVDIYGAWWRDGRWGPEKRLTDDPRIERHVSLAAKGDEAWMAWQAQSFRERRINHVSEQRIAVAKLENGTLRRPRGLWEALGDGLYLRPRISFDPQGRLWLTARKSTGQHSGWQAQTWIWGGGRKTGPQPLWGRNGRWRGVPLAWGEMGGLAAVQNDRLGRNGLQPNWPREVVLVRLKGIERPPAKTIDTDELGMPQTDFSLAEHMEALNADQPRQHVKHGGERLSLYWGDLHEHTDVSACARANNPPAGDLYANQRDIEKLDFTAITDHGYNTDEYFWTFYKDRVTAYFDQGRFVTLLGEEWTSKSNPPAEPGGPNRYGHRNLIFRNPRYPRFFDCFDGDISPDEIWAQLEGDEFIMIPHQLADWQGKGGGNPPTDWSYHHERHQPLAEIFQARGSYEYLGCPRQAGQGCPFEGHYLQDAWETGIIIGVIASPDHGGGQGRAGVWAPKLTRDSLFEAFHARHTFGTTGPKMSLFFSAGDAMMGDKVERTGNGPISFHIKALAKSPVKQVVIFRNNEIVYEDNPGEKELEIDWTDRNPPAEKKLWYYARIHCEDDALAWSSPIWFVR